MSDQKKDMVFLVDDEPDVCKAVGITLERASYQSQTFTSPLAALDALEHNPCDLFVCDVKMAELNGLDLLRLVRKVRPELPVIVLTAYADVSMTVQAMKDGAVDLLEKPLERGSFLDAIEKALAKQELPASEPLTRAERRVLQFVVEGKSNRLIARILHRSVRTVEDHRSHLMQKLGVTNIVELIKVVLTHKPTPSKTKKKRQNTPQKTLTPSDPSPEK